MQLFESSSSGADDAGVDRDPWRDGNNKQEEVV